MNLDTLLLFSNIRAYRRIVRSNYEEYLKASEEFDKFKASTTISYSNPDDLEKMALETVYENQLYDYSVTCLIFEALSVEALCNHLIAANLTQTYIDGLDRLEVINKFLIAIKMITQIDFPKNKHSFELLGVLIKVRNKLVHSKTIKINYENIKFEDLSKRLQKEFIMTVDKVILNKLVATYDSLLADISEISPELAAQYLDKS
jgi:hypothetical protein